jgi:S1-C subfamily serine protease
VSSSSSRPAARRNAAGIRTGDLITAVNEHPTTTLAALLDVLAGLKAGDTATLSVTRDGSSQSLSVVLQQQPSGA